MAETENQGLNFEVRVDDSMFNSGIERARRNMNEFVGDIESGGTKIDAAFKKIGASMGAYFTADAIKSFAQQIFQVHSNMQSLQTSFEVLLGSQERAASLMEEMRTFAVSTPMQLGDLASAAQTMLGFGISVEDVMPNLKALGDISMGDSAKFQSLSLAFSQMSATGKLMGQDLLQMINAGFNPLTEIARKTGKSVGELKDEMSKGAITSEMVAEAFQSATQEGGKFYGMLEKQSKGLRGAWSNLQGAWDEALDSIGQDTEGVFSGAIELATEAVKNFDKLGMAIGTIALMWGEYKASLMLVETAQKTLNESTAAFNAKQIEGIVKEFGSDEAATTTNSTTAIEANTDARRANYIASNEQLKAVQQKLLLDKAEADAAVEAARLAEVRAYQAEADAEAAVQAAQESYEAALKVGDGEAIEAAELELATAQQELNNASKQKGVAASNLKEAATKKEAAATKINSFNTAVDTAATQANSKSKALWATVTDKCAKAMRNLGRALSANWFGLAMMGVTALVGALGIFDSKADEASERVEKYGKKAADTIADIERLGVALENTGKDTQIHKKLVDELNEVAMEYGVSVVAETGNLEEENRVRTETIAKIKEEAGARQLLNQYTKQKNAAEKKAEEIYNQALKDIGGAEYGILPNGNSDLLGIDIKELRENKEQVVELMETTYTEAMESYNKVFAEIKAKNPELTDDLVKHLADDRIVQQVHNKVYSTLEQLFGLDLTAGITTSWGGVNDVIDKYTRANIKNEDVLERVTKLTNDGLEAEKERTKEMERQAKLEGVNLKEGMSGNAQFTTILDDFDFGKAESYQKYLIGVSETTSKLFGETSEVGEAIRKVAESRIGDLGLPELLTLQANAKSSIEALRTSINSANATPLSIAADTSQLEYVLRLLNTINGLIDTKFAEGSLAKLKEDRKKIQDEYEKAGDDAKRAELMSQLKEYDKQIAAKDIYGKSKNKGKGKGSKWDARQAEYDRNEMVQTNLKRIREQTAEVEAANRRLQNALLLGSDQTLAQLEEEFAEAQRKQTESYKAMIEQQKELDKNLWLKGGKDRKEYQYEAKDDAYYEDLLKNGEGDLHKWYVAWQKTNDLIKEDNIKKTADTLDELLAAYNAYGESRRENTTKLNTDIANLEKALAKATTEEEKRRIMAAINFAKQQLGSLDSELEGKYGNFAQRAKVELQEYDTDIANLQNLITDARGKGDHAEEERLLNLLAKAEEERAKALSDFAFREMQENINWEQVFGDLERVGTSSLSVLTEQLQKYIEVNKNLSPENIKTLTDAISNLQDEAARRDPFKGFGLSLKDAINGAKEQRRVKREMDKLDNTAFGNTTISKAYTEAITANDAFRKTEIENTKVTIQARNEMGEVVDITLSYKDALQVLNKDLNNSVNEQTKFQKKCGAIGESLSKVGGAGQELQGLAEQLGVTLPEGIQETLDGVNKMSDAMQSFASGDYIGGSIKAISGVIGIGKGLVNTIASIFGGAADYSSYNKALKKYEALKDVWADIISSKEEYLSMSWGREAVQVGLEAERVQDKSNAALRSLGKEWVWSGAGWFSHREGVKNIKALSGEARSQLASLGMMGVLDNKMANIFDLSAEKLQYLRDNAPVFWAELNEKTREYLEGIIDGEKKLEDLQNMLNERLTGTDFDSFLNGFLDMIADMDSSVSDFSKDFEEKMRKAILNSIMASMYKDKIKTLYDSWVTAAKDGKVTAAERDALKDAQTAIVEDMIAERDALNEVFGWSGQTDAEASTGGFATASQDSVEELNGRFAAMQIAQAYGNELALQSLNSINGLLEMTVNGFNLSGEIRDILLRSSNYLDDILSVNRAMYRDFASSLNRIALNTDNL